MPGNDTTPLNKRARLRTLLATGYALFIVYASLSPFSGWRQQGLSFTDMLGMPLRLTYTPFDATANFLSYLPLGLLTCLALRARFRISVSIIFSFCLGALLSMSMEYLQMYLPTRTSSNMDLLSNGTGALAGALLAARIAAWTWLVERLAHWRSTIFLTGSKTDYGLALLSLWMFGQINPSLPMLGNVFISEIARQPFANPPPAPFSWWECGAVSLNLLMLGSLMQTLLRARRNVVPALLAILAAVAAAKFITAALLLKSWALLLWINSEAMLGMLLGMLMLLALLLLPYRTAIAFGAVAALGYFGIVNVVFTDNAPAAAVPLYHWRYGHLLNYSGLAQTISLIFPLLLLFHLSRARKV